jgi:hypothetical protein
MESNLIDLRKTLTRTRYTQLLRPSPASRLLSAGFFYGPWLPQTGTQDAPLRTLEGCVTTCQIGRSGAEQSIQTQTRRLAVGPTQHATEKAPVAYVKPLIRPFAGKYFFGDSACQPQVRRKPPRIKNHRHLDGRRGVHQQARTRNGRNAKQTLPRCIGDVVFLSPTAVEPLAGLEISSCKLLLVFRQ